MSYPRPPVPAYIRARTVTAGRRFDVIYRRGGRYTKLEHAGTFKTRREALLRKRVVEDWLAQAKDPRVELARYLEPTLTVGQAGEQWLRGRRSIALSTYQEYRRRVARIGRDLDVEVGRLTFRDVNDWIDRLGLAPGTVSEYVTTLRAILDHAGAEPNPARDRRVELPRVGRRVLEVPTADDVLKVLARTNGRFRPVLVLIEQTGLRVSEACAVRTGHFADGRLLVPTSKTGRPRWVPVPPWLALNRNAIVMSAVKANRQTVHNALKAGCAAAKVAPFGPHMLRHRRASLWSAQGVPPAQAAAWLGHTVETYLRTYTHVVSSSEIAAHRLAALL